jgi:ATP-binding cassette subfamily C (CFTR/MRP) protein 10
LNILLAQGVGLLGSLAVVCYGLPYFAAALVPLSAVYYYIQRYYRQTSREVKRLSSLSKSPVYAHFSECCEGLDVIRAFRVIPRFIEENRERFDANQVRIFLY